MATLMKRDVPTTFYPHHVSVGIDLAEAAGSWLLTTVVERHGSHRSEWERKKEVFLRFLDGEYVIEETEWDNDIVTGRNPNFSSSGLKPVRGGGSIVGTKIRRWDDGAPVEGCLVEEWSDRYGRHHRNQKSGTVHPEILSAIAEKFPGWLIKAVKVNGSSTIEFADTLIF